MTQAPFPMPGSPAYPARTPGPSVRASVSLMAVGVAIGIASVVAIVVPLLGTFTSREYVVPVHLSLHLKHARYTVYERTGSRSGFVTHTGPVTIDPSQVVVTAPDGEPVFVQQDTEVETVNRGSRVFGGAVRFDAPVTGQYDIRLSTSGASSVVIARSLGDAIRSVLVWVGTGAVGGLIALVGLVMLIVGSTRRGRARRAAQFGWGYPPPGVYPAPPNYPPPGSYPPPPNPNDPWAPR